MRFFVVAALLLCSSLAAKSHSGPYSSPEWDEIRLEIEDLKQALHTTQVDLSLMEERTKKQESSLTRQGKELKESSSVSLQITSLEKRISSLEKLLDKVVADIRSVSSSTAQLASHLDKVQGHISSQEEKLGEVGKLKTTLSSLAQAIRSPNVETGMHPSSIHTVKSGDSLEKIAREYHTSASHLRKLNPNLTQDKIFPGQQLRVSDDAP